jgi:YebC/PmpR family DNA-binding regulatory protein
MPKDTIERAIKKGTGELDGGNLEQVLYEGYGPCGVAVMCDILTDNRNRTAPEIRKMFEMAGGNLGATGCVAWMFQRKGLCLISAAKVDEERLMELALDVGADDVRRSGDRFEVTCDPTVFAALGDALDAAGIEADVKQLTNIPNSTVDLDADAARKVLKLVETLDDHDDVQSVSANFNIPDDVMAEIAAE